MIELIEKGRAPDFSLKDMNGKVHSLSDYTDETLVLYFYPKDDTPGCTSEACAFRDLNEQIMERGGKVLGVSPDSADSHTKFANKFKLNFQLLTDTDHKVAQEYGAWREKNFVGNESEGILRSTFIIKKGKIAKAYYNVKVEGHVKEVLEELENI